ncbi:MAG: GNAT family N-acetyltransferase [Acidimicrobiales bacterium]
MSIAVATQVGDELVAMFTHAANTASHHRGGAAMLESILAHEEPASFLRAAVARNEVWVAHVGNDLSGFVLCRNGLIETVYVNKGSRRQGIATRLVRAVIDAAPQSLDAYALPGDRATKSFYESLGWKARLLTMRDA